MIEYDVIRNKLAKIAVIFDELEEAEIISLIGARRFLLFKERFVDFRLRVLRSMLRHER